MHFYSASLNYAALASENSPDGYVKGLSYCLLGNLLGHKVFKLKIDTVKRNDNYGLSVRAKSPKTRILCTDPK